jgi:hypothetical protein
MINASCSEAHGLMSKLILSLNSKTKTSFSQQKKKRTTNKQTKKEEKKRGFGWYQLFAELDSTKLVARVLARAASTENTDTSES